MNLKVFAYHYDGVIVFEINQIYKIEKGLYEEKMNSLMSNQLFKSYDLTENKSHNSIKRILQCII